MNDFLQHLRERKLVQWALAYIAATFALIQVIDVVAQRFGWPEQIERLLIVAMAVGFFVTIVLAWYHGEKGAQRVTNIELVVLTLVLAAGGVAIWHFDREGPTSTATASSGAQDASAVPASDKSIAVLPLANESGDKDEQYFSDGLSEDLITALSQFDGLKVISRNSSFQFRDSKEDSKTIGAKLGAAHLLEGSVRRAGDAVRVSAELVNVADGTTLWSQHYDRPYRDLFKLQDDITTAVAGELKAKLLTAAGAVVQSDRPPSGNLDAYNAYLQGKDSLTRDTLVDLRKAIDFFGTAISLDPRYARAYAALGQADIFVAQQFGNGAQEAQQAFAAARVATNKALALDPDLAATHFVRGLLLLSADLDWNGTEAEFQRAVQLAPNDERVKGPLGQMQAVFGHPERAIEPIRQTLASDSLNTGWYHLLAEDLLAVGRFDEAEQTLRKEVALQPTDCAQAQLVTVLVARGNASAALDTAAHIPPGRCRDFAQASALQIGKDSTAADAALKTLLDKYADTAAYEIAQVYALRKQPDRMFAWLDRAFANRDSDVSILYYGPFISRYRGDPRFAAFCEKIGLPTPAEVVKTAPTMPAGNAADASTTAPASGRMP